VLVLLHFASIGVRVLLQIFIFRFDAKQAKNHLFLLLSENFISSISLVSLWNRKQATHPMYFAIEIWGVEGFFIPE
jgi:hypothetical protein